MDFGMDTNASYFHNTILEAFMLVSISRLTKNRENVQVSTILVSILGKNQLKFWLECNPWSFAQESKTTHPEHVNCLTIKPAFFKCDVSSWNEICYGPGETLGCVGPSPDVFIQPDKCLRSTYVPSLHSGSSALKPQFLSAWWHPLQHAPTRPSVQKDTIGRPIPSSCGHIWNRAPLWWVNASPAGLGSDLECSSRPFSKIRRGAWFEMLCLLQTSGYQSRPVKRGSYPPPGRHWVSAS